jgi:hypothetical protein
MIGSRAWVGVAVGAALIAAQASAAELVVVEARGLTLKPGQTVDDHQKLTLQAGDELTMVDERGSVIRVRGPFEGSAASGKGSSIDISNALAALGTGEGRSAVGVVRAKAKAEAGKLPDPWVIDVTRSGEACVRAGAPVVFWRQQSTAPATLRIAPVTGAWHAESDWPAGASQMSAPAMLPIVDGQDYAFDLEGETATVRVVGVPASLRTDRMRAAWMLEKNCVNQAKALVATLK